MKKYKVKYKVLNLLFGQNVFEKIVEAENEKEAMFKVEHEETCFNKVLEIAEVK